MTESPLDVRHAPETLKDRYARMVLVCHSRQLDDLDPGDAETLVVATDWLAWRHWVDRGGHGVHFEFGLADWPAENDWRDIFVEASEWMKDADGDFTRFEGVSLGQMYTYKVGWYRHAWLRLWYGIGGVLDRFEPASLVYRGARIEFEQVRLVAAHDLVHQLADARGIAFEDQSAAHAPEPGWLFADMRLEDQFAPEPAFKTILRRLYETAADRLSSLNWMLRGRPRKVLVIQNALTVRALVDAARPGSGWTAIVIARHMPKTRAFLAMCRRAAAILAEFPQPRLSPAHRRALEAMRRRFDSLPPSSEPLEDATRALVRQSFFEDGAVETHAREVLRLKRLFARHRPSRVLVGDSENLLCRAALEMARGRGIPGEELLNGIFLSPVRMEARNGKPGVRPMVDRLYAWGAVNERWMRVVESTGDVAVRRVGFPVIGYLKRQRRAAGRAPSERGLILPSHIDRSDLTALQGNVFMALVESARALRDAGYADLRVKVHPGYSQAAYFEQVLAEHGIEAAVYKDGPLADHLYWADVVVGPINSSAMVEALALGVPYHAISLAPCALDDGLFPECPPHKSVAALRDGLAHGAGMPQDAALEVFCSADSIPDPAAAFWKAVGTE